jgi:hypothetical protein
MDWFKIQHGITTDSRIAVAARRTQQPRAAVLAVWLAVMEYASRNTPRGCITGMDAEELSTLLDIDTGTVNIVLEQLHDRGIIDTDGICGWQSLQHLSTDRVRAHRLRRKNSKKPPKSST